MQLLDKWVMRSMQNVETLFITTLDWNENMPSKPNDHMNDISFIMACTYLRGLQWSPLIVVQCALNDWANSAEEISRYSISSQCQNCGTYLVYGFMISHIRIAVPNLFSPNLNNIFTIRIQLKASLQNYQRLTDPPAWCMNPFNTGILLCLGLKEGPSIAQMSFYCDFMWCAWICGSRSAGEYSPILCARP